MLPPACESVMVVLRNRAYLGEVCYRGVWHRADDHYEAIIDPKLFDRAQKIIEARGDDHSRRASNSSDYLLAGRVTCAGCGRRFIGTSATGNKYRYRYYTCFSVNPFGKDHCGAERLPADQLEQTVLETLLEGFADTELITRSGRRRRRATCRSSTSPRQQGSGREGGSPAGSRCGTGTTVCCAVLSREADGPARLTLAGSPAGWSSGGGAAVRPPLARRRGRGRRWPS